MYKNQMLISLNKHSKKKKALKAIVDWSSKVLWALIIGDGNISVIDIYNRWIYMNNVISSNNCLFTVVFFPYMLKFV